jgi:PPOX class probable F420-dependent enzyme
VVDAAGDLDRALASAKRMYLTTYSTSGKAGTVPTWFMVKDGALYFTTLRTSLKARRIKATGRVRVALGTPAGPSLEGRAEWVDDRPDLEREVLLAYRRKYPLLVPLFMGPRIRKRLARKESVLIRITPAGAR